MTARQPIPRTHPLTRFNPRPGSRSSRKASLPIAPKRSWLQTRRLGAHTYSVASRTTNTSPPERMPSRARSVTSGSCAWTFLEEISRVSMLKTRAVLRRLARGSAASRAGPLGNGRSAQVRPRSCTLVRGCAQAVYFRGLRWPCLLLRCGLPARWMA